MIENYDVFVKKYGLPEFDVLDRDFEIRGISKDDDVVREILKKISSTIDFYVGFLEDIIQPDSRFYALKEANFLDKHSRVVVNNIYNKLIYFNRLIIEVNLDYSEESAALVVKNFFGEWQVCKKNLLPVVRVLKDSWSKKTETKIDGGYFG